MALKEHSNKVIDRHDAPELYCDGAMSIQSKNDVFRFTLHSDRLDMTDGKTTNRVVVGHIAMPAPCFVDLFNQMQQIMQQLQNQGAIATMPSAPATTN